MDQDAASDAQKSEELTQLVTDTLSRRGVLSDLKAKMRAEVYLALEEQAAEEGRDDAWATNSSLKQIAEDKNAREALRLVHEFLAFYGLSNTKSVLEAECPVLDMESTDFGGALQMGAEPQLVKLLTKHHGNDAQLHNGTQHHRHQQSTDSIGHPGAHTGAGYIDGMPAEVQR